MTIIRVVKATTNDFGPHNGTGPQRVDTEVVWEGSDIDELSKQYPCSQIFGADPLGHSEIEDGLIRFDYTFERQAADGSWEKISDPRRRITPVSQAEQAQDAENRRLFPGDFITEECPDCGDPLCEGECRSDPCVEHDEEYDRV